MNTPVGGSLDLAHVPELDALLALVVAAETGSISAAARRLGVSQQAASARVRGAEQVLGVAVFHRTTKGVALTPPGQAVVSWAHDVLRAATALSSGVAGLRPTSRRATLVAASNTMTECLLPGWAARLRARHPGVEVHLQPGNTEEVLGLVEQGAADLGFVEGPSVPRSLASCTVARDELVLVVAPDHTWGRRREGITAAELTATPLVVRERGSGTRRTLELAVGEMVPPAHEVTSTAAVRSIVQTTGTPAVLSSLAVETELASGRLRRVPVDDLEMPRRIRAVWHPRRRPTGAGADLLDIATADGRR